MFGEVEHNGSGISPNRMAEAALNAEYFSSNSLECY
jgi:hypothetical protein